VVAAVAAVLPIVAAHAGTTNLLTNPSAETAAGAKPAGWTFSAWGTNTATGRWQAGGKNGAKSLAITMASRSSGDAKWMSAAISVKPKTKYQLSDWYIADVPTSLEAVLTSTAGKQTYVWIADVPAAVNWRQAKASFTTPAGTAKISVYHLIQHKGSLRTDAYELSEPGQSGPLPPVPPTTQAPPSSPAPTGSPTPPATTGSPTPPVTTGNASQFNRAIVSLTFDDGWRSQFTNGVPLLAKYRMEATFYLLTSTITYPDYMSKEQMGQLATAYHHEIASHTVTHPHLPTLSDANIDGELKDSQATLRKWYGPTVAGDFASPYGEYNAKVLAAAKKYYVSHRSTDDGYNTKKATDFFNIKVQNVEDTTTPAQVDAWVKQAIKDRSWLVLVYHEVTASAADPTYAVTPANLEAELKLIQAKSNSIAVETVEHAIAEVRPQLGR
jgi:peptidoglycan/xylan/chitin deacetylase (PgdA/CDA1 family)